MLTDAAFRALSILGGSGIAGFIFGYAIKKVMKILAFVGGGIIALLAFLEYKHMIQVNWTVVGNETYSTANATLHTVTTMAQSVSDKMDSSGGLMIGGGTMTFMAAFLYGLKKG